MSTVRIKARIVDEFTRTTQKHIKQSDLPPSYTADEDYIYKVIPKKDYVAMLKTPDGVHMSELGLAATLDTTYEG